MTIPSAIEEYKKNIIECESLNESLFTKEDKDEWIQALHKRAERMTELYEENNPDDRSTPAYDRMRRENDRNGI